MKDYGKPVPFTVKDQIQVDGILQDLRYESRGKEFS